MKNNYIVYKGQDYDNTADSITREGGHGNTVIRRGMCSLITSLTSPLFIGMSLLRRHSEWSISTSV